MKDLGDLVLFYEQFFRSGGVVSLSEWTEVSQVTRSALLAAGDRHRIRLLEEQAQAAQGPLGLLALRAPHDGGAAHDDLLLAAAVAAVGAREQNR